MAQKGQLSHAETKRRDVVLNLINAIEQGKEAEIKAAVDDLKIIYDAEEKEFIKNYPEEKGGYRQRFAQVVAGILIKEISKGTFVISIRDKIYDSLKYRDRSANKFTDAILHGDVKRVKRFIAKLEEFIDFFNGKKTNKPLFFAPCSLAETLNLMKEDLFEIIARGFIDRDDLDTKNSFLEIARFLHQKGLAIRIDFLQTKTEDWDQLKAKEFFAEIYADLEPAFLLKKVGVFEAIPIHKILIDSFRPKLLSQTSFEVSAPLRVAIKLLQLHIQHNQIPEDKDKENIFTLLFQGLSKFLYTGERELKAAEIAAEIGEKESKATKIDMLKNVKDYCDEVATAIPSWGMLVFEKAFVSTLHVDLQANIPNLVSVKTKMQEVLVQDVCYPSPLAGLIANYAGVLVGNQSEKPLPDQNKVSSPTPTPR